MCESFRLRSCGSLRSGRNPAVAIIHVLLSLLICLSVACGTRQDARGPCPVIELSAIANPQTDSTKTVTLNDTTIRLSRTPLVATEDITGASASQNGDRWVVDYTVTDDAAKRVQEFSKQHIGGTLATVVNGKVHDTPRIAGAITGNSYRIGEFDRAEAERLASAIGKGCHR